MIRRIRILLATLVLLLTAVGWGQDDGTVSISLQRFLELTKTSQSASGDAPVGAALGAGTYRLTADRDWAEVQADIEVQSFRNGWNEIDLLPSQVLVAEASIDGKALPVYLKDDRYRFMIKGIGRHRLHLVYHLKVSDSGPASQLTLETPPTSTSKLLLQLPHENVQVTASPEIPMLGKGANGKHLTRSVLPQGQTVTLKWTPLEVHPELRGQTTNQESKVYARVYSLATVTEKAVRSKVQVDYSILRNRLDSLKLAIPEGTEVVDVACPNLASWSIKDSPEGRLLTVDLTTPWTGNQSVTLTLERPIEEINSTWELPLVRVLHAERVKGSLGIGASPGIEVSQTNASEVKPIDVTQLPPQVTQMAANPLLLAFEYHQEPFEVTLKTSKGKELSVLTATVDLAQATTLLTKEGKTASVFVFRIRNNRKQSMTMTIPQGSIIQNAFVNGKAVKPVLESEGVIRLPLVLSDSADASFTVEVTTLNESETLLPFASDHLEAPIIDIPISEFVWQVYLPLERQVWSKSGSMEPSTQSIDLRQGHLPVAFFVPQVGQKMAFRQLMVAEESPTINLVHSSELLNTGLWWIVLAGVLLMGSSGARRKDGWIPLMGMAATLIVLSQLFESPLIRPLLGSALMGTMLLTGVWAVSHGQHLLNKLRSKPELGSNEVEIEEVEVVDAGASEVGDTGDSEVEPEVTETEGVELEEETPEP
jgi:hypothetical protein